MKVNLKSDDYFTQLNNAWDDETTAQHERYYACKNTSRVMFYKGNNIAYKRDPTGRWADDDYFMEVLRNSPEAREWAIKKFGNWGKAFKELNELNEIYPEFFDTFMCGRVVSEFKKSYSYEDFVSLMMKGGVAMTSGKFPYINSKGKEIYLDHVFCIIGLDDAENLLLADPFGDYKTKYTSPKGYTVTMPKRDFMQYVKEPNEKLKWGHFPLEIGKL